MATSPSSHGTVEELSPRESWSSTLPPKLTTPSLPVVYNALHSPSIFFDLWLIVYHFHVLFCILYFLKSDILSVAPAFNFSGASLGWHPLYVPLPLLQLFQEAKTEIKTMHTEVRKKEHFLLCTSVVTLKVDLHCRKIATMSRKRSCGRHFYHGNFILDVRVQTWMELRVNTSKHLSRSREVTRLTSKAKTWTWWNCALRARLHVWFDELRPSGSLFGL